MSDKQQSIFYTNQTLAEVQGSYVKVKSLCEHDQSLFLGAKKEDGKWDIIEFTQHQPVSVKVILPSISGSPLHLDPANQFLLYSHSSTQLGCIPYQQQQQPTFFNIGFHPKYSFSMKPHLDVTLLIGKDCQSVVFMNQTRKPQGQSQSLARILQPYSQIVSAAQMNGVLAMACVSSRGGLMSVVVVRLVEVAGQPPQLVMVDMIQEKEFSTSLINHISLLNHGKDLLLCFNGSTLIKYTLNTTASSSFQRYEQLLSVPAANFFRVKQMTLLDQHHVLVQDSTGSIYIYDQQSLGVNKWYYPSTESRCQIIVNESQVLVVSGLVGGKSMRIGGLVAKTGEEVIEELLEEDQYTALQMMRKTGMGKKIYLKYHMKQQGYSDIKVVKEYLSITDDNSRELVELLRTSKIEQIQVFQEILNAALSKSQHSQPIPHESLTLLKAHSRFHLYLTLFNGQVKQSLPLSLFCFDLPFTSLIQHVVYLYRDSTHLIQEQLQLIFSHLTLELIEHYHQTLSILPLEYIEPSFLLKYLPPGQSPLNEFWQVYQEIKGNAAISEEEQTRIYMKISEQYMDQVALPGRALIILQEAAQKRGILGLNQMAMRAVDKIFQQKYCLQEEATFDISQILRDEVEYIEEDIRNMQMYFDKAKWIFVMDQQVAYQNYLSKIKQCLDMKAESVSPAYTLLVIQGMLNHHTSTGLLFLNDTNLAQIALSFIYSRNNKISTEHNNIVEGIYHQLQELSLSSNQQALMKNYLEVQVNLQSSLLSSYYPGLPAVSYHDLLLIQTCKPEDAHTIDKINVIMKQMIESLVKKSRNVKEKMLALSASATDENKWVKLFNDLIEFQATIVPKECQIDVYQLFVRKLLDNKVTQSIEQLIKSNIVPIDDLQTSVLRYLQDQYNLCQPEKFYEMAQNSKSFLEMLLKYDNQRKHQDKISQELKLLEVSFFLKNCNILIGNLTNAQIRSDFNNNKLIDRILQVYGFESYPESYQTLAELQNLIDPETQYIVLQKVLKHLNQTRVLESSDTFPVYLSALLEIYLLNTSYDNYDWLSINNSDEQNISTQDIIFKISCKLLNNRPLKKALLAFLVNHADKKSELYLNICQEVIKQSRNHQNTDKFQELQVALSQKMLSKAKFLINKIYQGKVEGVNIVENVLKQVELKYFEVKQLIKLLDVEDQLLRKLKTLKNSPSCELGTLMFDDEAYQAYLSSQTKVKKAKKQEPVQQVQKELTPLDKLMQANDQDDVALILDMDYSDWSGQLQTERILQEMQSQNVQQLPQIVVESILNKIDGSEQLKLVSEGLIRAEFNPLIIAEDLQSKLSLQAHLDNPESKLIREFEQIVTDSNILRLSILLDDIKPYYSQLLALALYKNKLEALTRNYPLIKSLPSDQLVQLLYGMLDKDSLRDMIFLGEEDDQLFKKQVESFNKQLERFDKLRRSELLLI